MNKIKSFSKRFFKTVKNNRGQGMVEYILMLVVVVAIVMVTKERLKSYVTESLLPNLTGQVDGVMNQ